MFGLLECASRFHPSVPANRRQAAALGLVMIGRKLRSLKLACGVALVIAAVLVVSYLSELPRYRFEQVAAELGHRLPEARPISAIKTGHLASPISWFWPAKTVWTFALPDAVVSDRFYIITLMYEEDQPTTRLVDVDCNNRKMIWYDSEEPDTAFPARDLWGQPVLAPNRKTYRRLRIQPPARPELMQAFCETDWTAEMKALNANPQRRLQ